VGKYDPLRVFLDRQPGDRVPMTFRQIEEVLSHKLPKSKQYPAWWSNSPSNNTMTQVWLDAGFMTEQVDTGSERLVFRRVRKGGASSPPGDSDGRPSSGLPGSGGVIARLQAALAGTVTFAPGFDPTEPTGETWDAER
jgi:hypothetical protein